MPLIKVFNANATYDITWCLVECTRSIGIAIFGGARRKGCLKMVQASGPHECKVVVLIQARQEKAEYDSV